MSVRCRPTLAVLGLLAALAAPAAVRAAGDVPLAIVNGDTVSTADLELELALMRERLATTTEPAPRSADVLKRLTQNRLVVQEGYRIGLDEQFAVKNQVTEAVRTECTKVLLDSVVLSVPPIVRDIDEARGAAARAYIEGLKKRYVSARDSTLLRSLDYASADPNVQQRLRDSEEVLAVIPPGKMTIKGLSRQIRFIEFHGLTGKPDAAARRDRIFEEWLVESLLRYQAKIQNVASRPAIRRIEKRLERELLYEETMKVLLDVKYAPTDAQVEAYYRRHLGDVTPAARVRLDSATAKSEAAARKLGAQLRQGVKLSWLAKTSSDLVPGSTPLPTQWVEPEMLQLAPAAVAVGHVLDPVQLPGGWLVAVIVEVEPVTPRPLADCRQEIVQAMHREHTRNEMGEMIARLEKSSEVRILPGAEAEVTRRIDQSRRDALGKLNP